MSPRRRQVRWSELARAKDRVGQTSSLQEAMDAELGRLTDDQLRRALSDMQAGRNNAVFDAAFTRACTKARPNLFTPHVERLSDAAITDALQRYAELQRRGAYL